MRNGKVKWYNESRGFGFIESNEGEDIFVHRSGLVTPFYGLEPDQEVVFEVKKGVKGEFAINVK